LDDVDIRSVYGPELRSDVARGGGVKGRQRPKEFRIFREELVGNCRKC